MFLTLVLCPGPQDSVIDPHVTWRFKEGLLLTLVLHPGPPGSEVAEFTICRYGRSFLFLRSERSFAASPEDRCASSPKETIVSDYFPFLTDEPGHAALLSFSKIVSVLFSCPS